MVRLAACLGVIFSLMAGPALAAQAGGSFNVGMRITGKGAAAARPAAAVKRYTWGAAAISVRRAGFGGLSRGQQAGALYWFMAERGGNPYRIAVAVNSGVVVKVIPA